MMKKNIFLKIIYLSVFVNLSAKAQNTQHSNLWLRASFQYNLAKNQMLETELMYRRQSDFMAHQHNPLANPLNKSFRLWYFYQANKNLTFQLSPISYWRANPLIRQASDIGKAANSELRLTLGLEFKAPLSTKLELNQRNWYERRRITVANNGGTTAYDRFRTRLGIKYNLTSKIALLAHDEVFVQFGKAIKPANLYDQNRITFGTSLKPSSRLKIDAGYTFMSQKRANIDVFDGVNMFYLNFGISLRT